MNMLNMSAANGMMGQSELQQLKTFMIQNLHALIAANPNYLTGGIPNKLLPQLYNMNETAKVMSNMNSYDVCWFL